ncbi:adenosylcobinamide-GDP ribazoletransferase [Aeromicrobium phragmitis]|uniref:Adenosylcobinamide-GDP ribazoletransferase n=1 Tax=Aeromicrobium phragmitis TaxID=2478914 RepID=A0A3L8PI12_9ACTN|nr:adenosylcobinamide-GDP ribazoletransferase [Aeromicrobium phragmitis]RLV54945.1 adenosylcobinamide-GDP ribazoletransferase [Aeromicrobium phragmitis]
MSVLHAWRLSVGTFTAIPVTPPPAVTPHLSGVAIALAPLAVMPLAVMVAAILWAGRELGLAPIAVAAVAVGALALGSRAFHLDGLSDTADGLTSSYDATRALEVVKLGNAGPAGAAALAIVVTAQVGALSALVTASWGPLAAGVLVCVSRATAVLGCMRGVRGARKDGLGVTYTETIAPAVAIAIWVVIALGLCAGYAALGEPWWRGLATTGAALLVIAWILRRAISRFGGVVGDVFGATVEISLAVLLLSAT